MLLYLYTMATARPFAYNLGPSIPGTSQVGNLSIGTPTSGFTNNPQYWNGPDEELGYVITQSVSGNTQPTEIPGVFASVGFFRTAGFNDSSFIQLSEYISRKYSTPQTFSSATEASIWLTDNGFWNSYVVSLCDSFTFIGNNATTTTNSAINDGTSGWDSSAYSLETFTGPVSVTFQTSANGNILMGGFSYNPTVNLGDTYVDTSYGIYLYNSDQIEIYENGGQAAVINVGTVVLSSDVWKVDYDGTSVKYYRNSTLLYTSTNAVTQPLHVFFPLFTPNEGAVNICAIGTLSPTPTTTPTPTETSSPTPTPTNTETPTPTPTVTPTNTPYPPDTYFFFRSEGSAPGLLNANGQLEFTTNGGSEVTYNPNITDEVVFYLTDKSGLYHPDYLDVLTYGGVLTMTQGSNTVILSADTGQWASYVNYISGNYLEVVQPSPNPFVSGSPINLVLVVNYPSTPTPTNTETPTPTPTITVTPTSTDLSLITTFTISGCSSLNVFVADLGPSALAPGDVFYFDFTGGTPSGCYSIVNKIDAVPTDGSTPLYFYASCTLCEEAYVTPTPTPSVTNTPTPSVTPTLTPTPSTSPVPVTGYGYNLIALPYNFPELGNSIMNNPGDNTSGSTEINLLSSTSRGFYFNSFDSSSADTRNYFSGFTGQSVTITFSQTGNTAIYSGDTNSFKYWESSPTDNGFVFGTGIGTPPTNIPSGTAVLIQSATTNYTIGLPVYVSLLVN
jgi:hypothetical protein